MPDLGAATGYEVPISAMTVEGKKHVHSNVKMSLNSVFWRSALVLEEVPRAPNIALCNALSIRPKIPEYGYASSPEGKGSIKENRKDTFDLAAFFGPMINLYKQDQDE